MHGLYWRSKLTACMLAVASTHVWSISPCSSKGIAIRRVTSMFQIRAMAIILRSYSFMLSSPLPHCPTMASHDDLHAMIMTMHACELNAVCVHDARALCYALQHQWRYPQTPPRQS